MATKNAGGEPCQNCRSINKYIPSYSRNPSVTLQRALRLGHIKCIRNLLKKTPNFKEDGESNIIAFAINKKNPNPHLVFKMLIEAGADVNLPHRNFPVLVEAIRCSDIKSVEALLRLGASLTCLTGTERKTPLPFAAGVRGNRPNVEAICNALIVAEADVNAVDSRGNTSLLTAVMAPNTQCVKALLEAGADVNVKNFDNQGVLALEMSNGFPSKYERLEILLNSGADVRTERTDVLRSATYIGLDKCLALLIKAGADMKNRSNICLDLACSESYDKCLEVLLDAGADVNQVSPYGRTALFASMYSNVYCTSRLLQAGVPVNLYDGLYMNALQSFVKKHGSNKAEIGLLLYAAGEKIDVPERLRLRRQQRRLKPIDIKISDYLQEEESAEILLRLDQICRKVIRKGILHLDQHQNLFQRIPKLPLPTCIVSYLLYGCSIS